MSSWGVLNYLKHENGLLSICLICGIGVYKIMTMTMTMNLFHVYANNPMGGLGGVNGGVN